MSVGGRDFVGSSAFLSGVKEGGTARKAPSRKSRDKGAASPEGLLALIDSLNGATVKQLADTCGQQEKDVVPLVQRLEKLDLAKGRKDGKDIVYSLSDLGRKARKFARMTQAV